MARRFCAAPPEFELASDDFSALVGAVFGRHRAHPTMALASIHAFARTAGGFALGRALARIDAGTLYATIGTGLCRQDGTSYGEAEGGGSNCSA